MIFKINEKKTHFDIFFNKDALTMIYLYKVLFLYNCFLDGWLIEINNKNQIKLTKAKYPEFSIENFIRDNKLFNY